MLEANLFYIMAYSNEQKKKKIICPAHLPDLEGNRAYRKHVCLHVKERIKGVCSVKSFYKCEVLPMVVYEAMPISSMIQGRGGGLYLR